MNQRLDEPHDGKEAKPERPAGALSEQLAFKSRFVLVFGEIDDASARRPASA